MAMTPGELADEVVRVIEGLPAQDLVEVLSAVGETRENRDLPGALRYQAWNAVEQARSDPALLLTLANPILAKAIGWKGAPLLNSDDVRGR